MPEACGVFGRGCELGAISAFLDRLPSGPSGLLIEGEAGIGKTTVWVAGVADAVARSFLVLSNSFFSLTTGGRTFRHAGSTRGEPSEALSTV